MSATPTGTGFVSDEPPAGIGAPAGFPGSLLLESAAGQPASIETGAYNGVVVSTITTMPITVNHATQDLRVVIRTNAPVVNQGPAKGTERVTENCTMAAMVPAGGTWQTLDLVGVDQPIWTDFSQGFCGGFQNATWQQVQEELAIAYGPSYPTMIITDESPTEVGFKIEIGTIDRTPVEVANIDSIAVGDKGFTFLPPTMAITPIAPIPPSVVGGARIPITINVSIDGPNPQPSTGAIVVTSPELACRLASPAPPIAFPPAPPTATQPIVGPLQFDIITVPGIDGTCTISIDRPVNARPGPGIDIEVTLPTTPPLNPQGPATIVQPLPVSPSTGNPVGSGGIAIDITGPGFAPGTPGTGVIWTPSGPVPIGPGISDNSGIITIPITIPERVPQGSFIVGIVGQLPSGGLGSVQLPIDIAPIDRRPAPELPEAAPRPTDRMTIGPVNPRPGQEVTIELPAGSFAPNSPIRIGLLPAGIDLGTVPSGPLGELTTEVTIPVGLPAGSYTLVVSGYETQATQEVVVVSAEAEVAGTAAPAATGGGGGGATPTGIPAGFEVGIGGPSGVGFIGLALLLSALTAGFLVQRRRWRS